MKRILSLVITLISLSGFSQNVSESEAKKVANAFFEGQSISLDIQELIPQVDARGETLFYIANTLPSGYVIVSANELISPIIAWSTTSQFDVNMPITRIVKTEIESRISMSSLLTKSQKEAINSQWLQMKNGNYSRPKVQCWPEDGTTSTEGWVNTRWKQTSPYNKMCPNDPVTNSRSYAGCPAIVMGQILNSIKTTQNTRFGDSDDYQHSYAGRNYHIDNDAKKNGFPSFPELNTWLDSIDVLFESGADLTDSTAAAIVFACGTACTQVYTSQASGTFEVSQAYDAYIRFGFENCELHETLDSVMYSTLISNLKEGYPAHLAVVDEEWSTGHNVVVDGYRDDGYFHINFGWGGTSDGWWLLPDASFPYSLSVLEGIVLNIIPVTLNNSIDQNVADDLSIYPNPATDVIYFKSNSDEPVSYSIISITGNLVRSGKSNGSISVKNLRPGIYFVKIGSSRGVRVSKIVVE